MSKLSGRLSLPASVAELLRLSPHHITITGGSGWIGQATLEMLEGVFGDNLSGRVAIFGSSERDLTLRSGRKIPCRALNQINQLPIGQSTLLIHCAFLTKDRLQDQNVETFVAANKEIQQTIVNYMTSHHVLGIFAPSSGAVYRKGTHELDNNLAANPYGMMKQDDEKRFAEIAATKNIALCMPRLFNLAGPFINKIELYALASMIAAVLAKKPISIHAAHRVYRSYIHVRDLVSVGFGMMLNPQPGQPAFFDAAGEEILEMSELADKIRLTLGNPAYPIERPAIRLDQDDYYVGDSKVMDGLAAFYAIQQNTAQDQIRDTRDYLASILLNQAA